MAQAKKALGAVVASGLLMTGAVGVASALPVDEAKASQPTSQASVAAQQDASREAVSLEKVAGTFSYTQDAITSNQKIASMFSTAVASLCSSTSQYVTDGGWSVDVNGSGFTASDLKASDKAKTKVIGCVCSANPAGGGAVANVQATGVSIADLIGATK